MPKKNSSWGLNPKAAEARERKVEKKHEEQRMKEEAKEDAYWYDENKLEQRKQARKQNEQQKKADAIARKQETRKLLEQEESKISSTAGKTPSKAVPKKVTLSEAEKVKEQQRKQHQELLAIKEKERQKLAESPDMEEENPNRKMAEMLAEQGMVEARNIEDVISVLTFGEVEIDKHPEKRMKAAYTKFEQRELPSLKAEYPNLRLSQLKQMLHKKWEKSPDNPMNSC